MFQTVSVSIIRSLALYTCNRYRSSLLASSQHNLCDIYLLLCVQCETPDDGQRNCPKHVEFYSKNKFDKLVQCVGFIIRIYHDAQSSECQIQPDNLASIWSHVCWINRILLYWLAYVNQIQKVRRNRV